MATQISDQLFVNAVHELVAENPEFVYQQLPQPACPERKVCLYIHEGKGSCLIGQALVRAGVPAPEIRLFDESLILKSATTVTTAFGISSGVAAWAHDVQSGQDHGLKWRDALDDAEHKLPARFQAANA